MIHTRLSSADTVHPGPFVRLARRLERSDPFLMRAIQAAALIGCVVGVLIYGWQVVRHETSTTRSALAEAAWTGEVAVEADLARIYAAGTQAAPLIAAAMADNVPASEQRALQLQITQQLADTPVTAIILPGTNGAAPRVFGEMPSGAEGALAPRPYSRRAGSEALELGLVSVGPGRAAVYRDLTLAGGRQVPAVLVLRSGAFQSALHAGSAAGEHWRAALLNLDGDAVVTASDRGAAFDAADLGLASGALGWLPLHTDDIPATSHVSGEAGARFMESRGIAGGALQLVYIGTEPTVIAVLAARRFEFMALFGASLLAVLLAVSVIQNEWQRQDREVRDADLSTALADITCDLLAAGVIDWSVAEGTVHYSEGWADMFAQGVEPTSEDIFDWIARIHPDDRLEARQVYQRMLEGGESELVHRLRVRMSTGLWVQVVERGRALVGASGTIKRIILVQTTEPVDGSMLRNVFGETKVADSRTG